MKQMEISNTLLETTFLQTEAASRLAGKLVVVAAGRLSGASTGLPLAGLAVTALAVLPRNARHGLDPVPLTFLAKTVVPAAV